MCVCFFFKAEDGIRYLVRYRGLGDVYKRQDPNGCEVEAAIFDVIAAVSPISRGEGQEVTLFPNPATDKLEVFIPSIIKLSDVSISVYNMLGEELNLPVNAPAYQNKNLSAEIVLDIHQLAVGMYQIVVNDGQNLFRNKFNKQ